MSEPAEIDRNYGYRTIVWLALPLVFVLCACVSGDAGGDEPDVSVPSAPPQLTSQVRTATSSESEPSSTSFVRPTSISRPTETVVPDVISRVVARAADDYDVAVTGIELLMYDVNTWPSTALGCPEAGRSYAQIVTTGFRVVLRIRDILAVYHVDETGTAIIECEGQGFGS